MASRKDLKTPEEGIEMANKRIAKALERIADALTGQGSPGGQVTKQDLTQMEARIMSAISDFKVKQDAHNAKMSTGLDGLVVDIQTLNDKITALQNSAGGITPEDQALLDQIEAAGAALADRVTALDDLTPPPVPVP